MRIIGVLFIACFWLNSCDGGISVTGKTKSQVEKPSSPTKTSPKKDEDESKPEDIADDKPISTLKEISAVGAPLSPSPREETRPVEELKQDVYQIALLYDDKTPKGNWRAIADVKNGVAEVKPFLLSDVQAMNKTIAEFIAKNDTVPPRKLINKTFKIDELESRLLEVMRFRRCTVYLFLQTSPVGTRLLAYGSTLIKHHAISFGTSLDLVFPQTIKDFLTKEEIKLPKDTKYFL